MKARFNGKINSQVLGVLGAFALAATLTGCGMGTTASSTVEPAAGVRLSGFVHGGEQGVVGATIQLYAVGTTGYGSKATPLITGAAITTDQFGFWNITGTYSCPSAATQVYITATGGNPGLAAGTNNTAIFLVAALGSCGNLSATTGVDINEVTTVAAAFAMGQFFGTNFAFGNNVANGGVDSFGSPNTTQGPIALTNAIATTARLANTADGTAVTSQTLTSSLGNITTTAESAKVYTIANILSACVNTVGPSSPQCSSLFATVGPNGATAPVDVLQAAVYMSLNPTSNNQILTQPSNSTANITTLYNLQPPTPPFTGLAAQPVDWTLGINYSAGTSTTQTLIDVANDIAIDGNGNVWLINYDSSYPLTESLTELSPTGVPLANPFNTGAAYPSSFASVTPRNIAIDSNNNVFVPTSTNSSIAEYSAGGTMSTLAITSGSYGVAINGTDVYALHSSGVTGTSVAIDIFQNGTLASGSRYEFPYNASPLNEGQYLAITTNGTLYISAGSGTSVTSATGVSIAAATAAGCNPGMLCTAVTPTYTSVTGSGIATPFAPAAGGAGAVWIPDYVASSSAITYINGAGAATAFGTSQAGTNGLSQARRVAVDGANNAWVLNYGTGNLSEITTAGLFLSPYPASGATSPVGFQHVGSSTVTGLAIDPSGNVWISNATKPSATVDPDSIFELVGAAAPTITPIATAVKAGTTGTRP